MSGFLYNVGVDSAAYPVLFKKVEVTATELINVAGLPKELLPNQANGFYYNIVSVQSYCDQSFILFNGTLVFIINYTGAATYAFSSTSNLLNSGADTFRPWPINTFNAGLTSFMRDASVYLDEASGGPPTVGNGTLYLYLAYQILPY